MFPLQKKKSVGINGHSSVLAVFGVFLIRKPVKTFRMVKKNTTLNLTSIASIFRLKTKVQINKHFTYFG